MVYVALLRGINVGGKNKVEMTRLIATFKRLGLNKVLSYINSGNIMFYEKNRSQKELVQLIESAIEEDFGFQIKVLLRNMDNIRSIAGAIPSSWVNDQTMKCDVMFLWQHADDPKILDRFVIRPELEDVKYVNGAIIWRVDRKNAAKSGMLKLVCTDLYKNMTIRNVNTTRKLYALMQQADTL